MAEATDVSDNVGSPHEDFRGAKGIGSCDDVLRMPWLRHLIEGRFIRAVEGGYGESCEKLRSAINEKVPGRDEKSPVAVRSPSKRLD
jgi:hypothetical protein